VERAQLDAARVLLVTLLGDGARHVAAPRIDGLALLLLAHRRVDAQVLARRQAETEEVAVVDAVHLGPAEGGRGRRKVRKVSSRSE